MPDITKITLPSGTTYDIKDAQARSDIASLQTSVTGAMHYIGISTAALTDGGTQKPTIDGTQKTMTAEDSGSVCIYGEKEYVWNGSKWQEFGSTGSLKALAFKDNATGNFTPAGSVSQPTFSNGSVTASGSVTADGSVSVSTNQTENKTTTVSQTTGTSTYTPEGSVAAPVISVKTAGSTTTVNSITAVGSLPDWSATVSGETLTIGWSAGTLPTKGSNTTVKTGDAAYEATAPTFTGTGVRLVTGNIAVPKTYTASFTGTPVDVEVSGTATGTVSKPSFTGTQGSVTVS